MVPVDELAQALAVTGGVCRNALVASRRNAGHIPRGRPAPRKSSPGSKTAAAR
jgi:hypothetical protein